MHYIEQSYDEWETDVRNIEMQYRLECGVMIWICRWGLDYEMWLNRTTEVPLD